MKKEDISTFDSQSDYSIIERGLPHWSQAGTICFVTWRLADTLPQSALNLLDGEIEKLLAAENLSWENFKDDLTRLGADHRIKFQQKLFQIRDRFLDSGYGKYWLSQPECARLVLDSLLNFDEQRYFLTDAAVMPNHVHFLCAFAHDDAMLKQCEDWKRFTARGINRLVGRTGKFWQANPFDHLIRSSESFKHYREYVRTNPVLAGLRDDQYLHFSKPLT